jgi:RNA polymerase sigma factor for flagellar operon FliA
VPKLASKRYSPLQGNRRTPPHHLSARTLRPRPGALQHQTDWDAILAQHLPQVRLVAKGIWDRLRFAVELDDLIGFGMVGLVKAVERFDASRGILLKTYAEHRIRGAILDGLRDMDWLPRSARQKERRQQMERAAELQAANQTTALFNSPQNGPKPNQTAAKLPPPSAPRMEFVFTGGGLGDLEKLAEMKRPHDMIRRGEANPESLYARKETCSRLIVAISRLPQRQQLVIEMYYRREMSMKQIGAAISVHESRVSQIHAAAIQKLRNYLVDGPDDPGLEANEPREIAAAACRCSKMRTTVDQSSSVSTPTVSSEVSPT